MKLHATASHAYATRVQTPAGNPAGPGGFGPSHHGARQEREGAAKPAPSVAAAAAPEAPAAPPAHRGTQLDLKI